ncbi:MAG: tryptophan--tRNA ligase [Candidatus Aenigmarchaeota archaeon]|nr:tryptophan--tRNA ligase [Candidatus Aenigmarchaeota archaeon]
MADDNIIDPFGSSVVKNYDEVVKQFGLKPVDNSILDRIKNPNRFLRRGIDFGHIDFDKFLDAYEEKKPLAIMTGIKPTNEFHLGSKITAEKIIYFQKEFKAKVFFAVADLEGNVDNGLPLDQQAKTAVHNVADLFALGLNPKNAYIYRQSQERRVMNLAYLFSRRVTTNHMKNLYGERQLGLYFAAFTQAGDILLPQLEEFGGPKNVLVPVGSDQVPHIFLTRDIAEKFEKEFGFIRPSTIVHKFFKALNGESKMSKRDPMSMITLGDSPEIIRKKINMAVTGGRKTVEEQRRLGGVPEDSVVYELYNYHFVDDDNKVRKVYDNYKSGKLLDGEMKKDITEIVIKFLENHQKKRGKMLPLAEKLVYGK